MITSNDEKCTHCGEPAITSKWNPEELRRIHECSDCLGKQHSKDIVRTEKREIRDFLATLWPNG